MTLEELCKEVLDLNEKATKGPFYSVRGRFNVYSFWEDKSWEDEGFTISPSKEYSGWETDNGCDGYGLSENNANLLAHYRTSAPKLAKACLMMREKLALFAEGEGPDEEVYMQMANATLAQVEKIMEEK